MPTSRAALIMLLPPLFWAGNFTIGRAVGHLGVPVSLSFWRWQVALLLLLPFILRPLYRERHLIRRRLASLALLAVLSVSGFNTLAYIGLQHTSATNATLMNSFVPAWVLLIAILFLAEKPRLRQLLGLAISMLGILAIVSRLDWQRLSSLSLNQGDVWMLVATLIWAIYSVLLKKHRPHDLSAMSFLGIQVILGWLILLPVYLWNPLQEAGLPLNAETGWILLYVALFPSIIAYLAWNFGMQRLGATVGSQFIHFTPLFGAILASLFLGEQVQLFHLVGAVCIASGLWLSLAK